MKKNRGLTLIEVLIALTLFTFISFYLFRITDATLQYRKKMTRNLKDNQFSRNAEQVLKQDIRNIFYKPDINNLVYTKAIKGQKPRAELIKLADNKSKSVESQTAQFELSMRDTIVGYQGSKPVVFLGGLIGKRDQLHLSSLSRMGGGGGGGDQNAITYYLKNCKNRISQKENLCLWRKSSVVLEQELDNLKDYSELVLLEKVKKWDISYYDLSTNEWKNEWKTGLNERGILPSAIRMQLEFEDSRKKLIKKQLQITLHQSMILPVGR